MNDRIPEQPNRRSTAALGRQLPKPLADISVRFATWDLQLPPFRSLPRQDSGE
jgi:hypothetical protein